MSISTNTPSIRRQRGIERMLLAVLSLGTVLVQAKAFSFHGGGGVGSCATKVGSRFVVPTLFSPGCVSMARPVTPLLASLRGGATNGAEGGRDVASSRVRVREVRRNGYTSDGRRRLLSMRELFGHQEGSPEGNDSSGGLFSAAGSQKLFSRDGALRLVGYAAVAYIGKQVFNGGRYDENPDLAGRVAVITGGNTGIGKETAIRLASMGARVLIACRNPEKGETAVRDILDAVSPPSATDAPVSGRKAINSPPQVESLVLDLADLKSIDRFATELGKRVDWVDMLINNAGVMAVSRLERTKDGFERHLGVNHLGHFHLTNRLFDLLLKGGSTREGVRIVNVASEAHRFGGLDPQDPNYLRREYKKWEAYGQSKLANILFTRELHRRLAEKGLDKRILAVCCHPGVVRTELGRYLIDDIPSVGKVALAPLALAGWYFTKSPKQG